MMKTFLLVACLLIAVAGIWFYRLAGPAQLDLADRWWPGHGDATGPILRGLAYGDPSGTQQRYDIYFPAGASADEAAHCGTTKYPALLFFHGGSWRDGDRESYAFVGRAFAARGFITFIADYRKAPAHRFPDFIDDAAAAIASARRELGKRDCADPDRLFVMGHSAGAQIAALLLAMSRDAVAAGGQPVSELRVDGGATVNDGLMQFQSDLLRVPGFASLVNAVFVGRTDDEEAQAAVGTVIDAATGEVIDRARAPAQAAARPELPAYATADFEKNLPAWSKLVADGKKTASALLAMLQTKATFSEEQKARILALKPAAEDATPAPAPAAAADDDFAAAYDAAEEGNQ